MGMIRKELNDAIYNKRRAYYEKNREKMIERGKARYKRVREFVLAKNKRDMEAERAARLEEKRQSFYRERGLNVPEERWTKATNKAKAYVQAYKENSPCLDCNTRYPFYVMDLDHVRGEKKAIVSDLVAKGKSIKKIQDEILKCDLVCANCHRIRTFKRTVGPL